MSQARELSGKIGVGVLTGLITAAITYLAWEAVDIPHRIDLIEWTMKFRGLWVQ